MAAEAAELLLAEAADEEDVEAAKILELHKVKKKFNRTSSKPSDKDMKVKGLFKYYTWFQSSTFNVLFDFLIPDAKNNPLKYKERKSHE